jgi:acyl-CoA synthetase (NDP forming)
MGVGFSKMVSLGNEADLCFEDFLEYLAQDDETDIITGYIEGLRNGRDFFRLAREITKKKPIVVVKVGRTEAGTRAARGHTGHLAGSDLVYDAMFKQAGVIRADTVEELFDVAAALVGLPLPKGNRVAILTGGGGFGCVTSDACERLGLNVAPLSPQTIEKLNAVLPARWPHANPVDTVAAGYPTTYPCLWPLIEDDNLDAVLPVGGIGGMGRMPQTTLADVPPALRAQTEQMLKDQEKAFEAREQEELRNLDKLIDYMDRYQKTVIIYGRVSEDMRSSPVFNKLKENHIPMYPTPERAAKVLMHLVEYSRYLNES